MVLNQYKFHDWTPDETSTTTFFYCIPDPDPRNLLKSRWPTPPEWTPQLNNTVPTRNQCITSFNRIPTPSALPVTHEETTLNLFNVLGHSNQEATMLPTQVALNILDPSNLRSAGPSSPFSSRFPRDSNPELVAPPMLYSLSLPDPSNLPLELAACNLLPERHRRALQYTPMPYDAIVPGAGTILSEPYAWTNEMDPKQFQYSNCDLTLPLSEQKIRQDIRKKHKDLFKKGDACQWCQNKKPTFNSFETYSRHLLIVHILGRFRCSCGKKLVARRDGIRRHWKKHCSQRRPAGDQKRRRRRPPVSIDGCH